jgi:hypothetical protein
MCPVRLCNCKGLKGFDPETLTTLPFLCDFLVEAFLFLLTQGSDRSFMWTKGDRNTTAAARDELVNLKCFLQLLPRLRP